MAVSQGDGEGTRGGSLGATGLDERHDTAFARFFEAAQSLFAIIDHEGRFRRLNPAWERVLGHPTEELVGRLWRDFVHPDDAEVSASASAALRAGAEPIEGFENRYRHADGSYRWLRWFSIYRSSEALVYSVANDVTDLKRSEEELRRYREHLERSEQVAQLGNWALDFATDQVTASPGMKRLAGIGAEQTRDSLQGALERIDPEDRAKALELVARLRAGEPVVRQRYRGRRVDTGQERVIDSTSYTEVDADGEVASAYGVVQDVTERVEAEEREREAREMERASFRDAPLGMCLVDLSPESGGRFLRVNRAFAELLDRDEEELLEMGVQDVVHPDDWEASRDHLRALAHGELGAFSIEKRYLRSNGATVWILVHASAFHVAGRDTPVALEQMENITDRKRAEQDLIESRQFLQAIIDAAPAAIFVKDLEGRYLVVNDWLARSQGFVASDVVGRRDDELFPPELVERWHPQERKALASERPVTAEEWIPVEGVERLHLTQRFALRDADGRPYAIGGTGADITDRVRAEEENRRLEASLQQSQRLETVGRLAGGIAHDFNNLLAIIVNYTRLAADTLPADSSAASDLTQVASAAERAAELTHELVVFSRQEMVKPQVLDPNEIVARAERLLRRTIGEDVELRLELAEDVPPVEVDPGQLERVLMNLAVNARDAMPTGGALTIATDAVSAGGNGSDAGELSGSRRARITVRDSGTGMSEEVAARAFEPFFTTKPQGEGTGLGLATVHGIVSQAGGTLELETASGEGTMVSVHLPASDRPIEPVAGRPGAARPATGEDRRILVVEDDDAVRRLVVRLLRRAGYAIIEAPGPEHALREAEALGEPIDLMLTDLVMPRMSGRRLAERMRELCPDVEVLYMSGYTEDVVLRHGIAQSEVRMLAKPFTREGLLSAVSDALVDARPRGGRG